MQFPDEQRLIARAQNGDQGAYALMVERYKDYVFTIAVRITNNREEAEEAAQDAFVNAWRALPKFHGEAKFSTWLYRIAYNSAISMVRKKQHHFADIDTAQIPEGNITDMRHGLSELSRLQRKEFIRQALDQLSGDDAGLLQMYYFDELSISEIEAVTGWSTSNIKVKLHRTRKALYKVLQSLLKDELEEIR